MSCIICAETLNGSSRKNVKCEFCDFEACLTCCKTFLLSETTAKCMDNNCNKEWTRQFITKTFGQTFVGKALKGHREQVLYDKERSLLPATQPIVEQKIYMVKLRKELIEIDAERSRLAVRKRLVREELDRLLDYQPDSRVVFTRSCPATECRGFLSTQLKCGLCSIWACSECHEVKGETRDAPHVCNPDTVATAKLLAADTKACPTCHTQIYKIDGCDQMWCTLCHTAFSWKSGIIETKIHNPHYYEYLRKQSATGEIPREIGDGCPRTFTHNTIRRIRQKALIGIPYQDVTSHLMFVSDILRNTIHNEEVELTGRFKEIDYLATNQDLRVDYMRGLIDEAKFKTLLQRNEKGVQKRREIRAILQMVQTAVTDTTLCTERKFETITPDTHLDTIVPSFLEELEGIRVYANEQLMEIAKTYKSAPIVLLKNMKLGNLKELDA